MHQRRPWHKGVIAVPISLLLLIGFLVVTTWIDPPVNFPDPGLEAAVREALERPSGPIYYADVRRKAKLDASGRGIASLAGIEHFHGLDELILTGNAVTDLAPLAGLEHLATVTLRDNALEDLTPLAGLSHLRKLDLRGNRVSDLSPLQHLGTLTHLNLRGNPVTDILPLSGLTGLKHLNLHSATGIRSVVPLATLTNLEELILRDVPVGDQAAVLAGMHRLESLNLRGTGIADATVIRDLLAAGALEDVPARNRWGTLDLRDTPLLADAAALDLLKPFWQRITYRYPDSLGSYPTRRVALPVPSLPGGLYADAQQITLTAEPNAAIHYTLDGTEPTQDSPCYSGPIAVEGTTVLRAVAVAEGAQSNIRTVTYLVGVEAYSMPVVSVVTPPQGLFDPLTGIYTTRNMEMRGEKWERAAHVEYFPQEGGQGFAQDVGIRIHGGNTRAYPQKSLRLIARADYGRDAFHYPLFPHLMREDGRLLDTFGTLVLRAGGNDAAGNENNGTLLRDPFQQALVADLDLFDTQASRPVALFLNGKYWGLYALQQTYDVRYLAETHGAAPEDISILEMDALVRAGTDADAADYVALRTDVDTLDMTDPTVYATVQARMDVESFAAYVAAEAYFGNTDWPQNNIKFWRRRLPDGRHTPWRWMLYDVDYGYFLSFDSEWPGAYASKLDARIGAERDPFPRLLRVSSDWGVPWPNTLLRGLLRNPDFRTLFLVTLADQLNTVFAPDKAHEVLDAVAAQYKPGIPAHYARWLPGYDPADWDKYLQVLYDYATLRPDALRRHIVKAFDLAGTTTLTVTADAGGQVAAGTAIVPETSWQGTFFVGVPVTLTAKPAPGYRFTGWEDDQGAPLSGDAVWTLVPGQGDVHIRARFTQ